MKLYQTFGGQSQWCRYDYKNRCMWWFQVMAHFSDIGLLGKWPLCIYHIIKNNYSRLTGDTVMHQFLFISAPNLPCWNTGWTIIQGWCIMIGQTKVNYSEALQFCNSESGNLVNIDTHSKKRLLKEALYVTPGMVTWGPFYWHKLAIVITWISNFVHCKVWEEITYPFHTSTVQPLKFGNGQVISSNTLQWIITHVGIEVKPC